MLGLELRMVPGVGRDAGSWGREGGLASMGHISGEPGLGGQGRVSCPLGAKRRDSSHCAFSPG